MRTGAPDRVRWGGGGVEWDCREPGGHELTGGRVWSREWGGGVG